MPSHSNGPGDEEWERHKVTIRRHIVKGTALKGLMSEMEGKGLIASKAQYEYRLKAWGFRKNMTSSAWKFVGDRIEKRKRQGKASEIVVAGIRYPPVKVEREVRRHGFVSALEKVQRGTSPECPHGLSVSISTPPALPLEFPWESNLPWIRFETWLENQTGGRLPFLQRPDKSRLPSQHHHAHPSVSNLLTATFGEFAFAGDVSGPSRAARAMGVVMPELYEGEHLARADLIMTGDPAEVEEAVIKMAIYKISNGMFHGLSGSSGWEAVDDDTLAPLVQKLQKAGIITVSWIRRLKSTNEPTALALLEKLFQIAVKARMLDVVTCVLHAGIEHEHLDKALDFAAKAGDLGLVEQLAYAGARPIETSSEILWLRSPTWVHVRDLSTIAGAARLPEHRTATDIVEVLLRHHGDVEGRWIALQAAAVAGNQSLVKLLIQHGADPHYSFPTSLSLHPVSETHTIVTDMLAVWQPATEARLLEVSERLLEFEAGSGAKVGADPALRPRLFTPEVVATVAAYGTESLLRLMHHAGLDLDVPNPLGVRPLAAAAAHRQANACRYLLSVNVTPTPGLSDEHRSSRPGALHLVAAWGAAGLVESLLESGAERDHVIDIHEEAEWKVARDLYCPIRMPTAGDYEPFRFVRSPLQASLVLGADFGSASLLLLDSGAALIGGEIAQAARHRNLNVIRRLLERGANPMELGSDGLSAVQIAKDEGHASLAAAIQSAADGMTIEEAFRDVRPVVYVPRPRLRSEPILGICHGLIRTSRREGYSSRALCASVEVAVTTGDYLGLQDLLNGRRYTPANFLDPLLEATAVALALATQHRKVLGLLLDHPRSGHFCLMSYSHRHVVLGNRTPERASPIRRLADAPASRMRGLLGHGWLTADQGLTGLDRSWCSPLVVALAMMDSEMVPRLLEYGYAPDRVSLQIAIQSGQLDMLRVLLENDNAGRNDFYEDRTPLQLAAELNETACVRVLLSAGADPNIYGVKYRSALQAAVERGNPDMVGALVDSGADIDASAPSVNGATALQTAARKGYIGIARYLIGLGADVDAPGSGDDGRTALEAAAEHGRIDMIQYFLNLGVATEGLSTLQYLRAVKLADKNGHIVAAKLLMSHRIWKSSDHVAYEVMQLKLSEEPLGQYSLGVRHIPADYYSMALVHQDYE